MAPARLMNPSAPPPADWWQKFFASPDCLPLSFFPSPGETEHEVAGLRRLLRLLPGQRVLDVCCGEGRHLLPLAQAGLEATGLDLSPLLLSRARGTARRLAARVALVRGDARRLPFRGESFDAVLNLFNSFGYCETDAENEQVLAESARCLRPGGQFLLETRNPQFQILFAPVHQEVRAADGRLLIMRCRYDLSRHRLEIAWTHREGGPPVHAGSIRLYQLAELRDMAARSGLEEVGVYGDFAGTPYSGHERLLLLHWRRP